MSEREPNAEAAPQAAEASAAGLGTEPPSCSESAALPDHDARMLAWANAMRSFKQARGEPHYALRGTAEDRDIAYARDLYVRDVIELDEFERLVGLALASSRLTPSLAST